MNAREPDRERTARLNRDHMTRRLDGPIPNLETLSISELESLLAEKRRRESKRILRVIAGRTANEAAGGPAAQSAGPSVAAALVRKGRLTRRLLAEEVRAALGRPPAGGWTSPP